MKLPYLTTTLAALVSIGVSANAQSSSPLTAKVPFDFVVKDKTLSPGRIQILRGDHPAVTIVRNDDGTPAVFVLTNPVASRRAGPGDDRLVFHRYGGTYFLAEIWRGGNGLALTKSKRELELAGNIHIAVEVPLALD
jgi:hypothetical protein